MEVCIYPKSIIGTNKEGDSYYYASASVNKLTLGRLDEPGDSYSYVARNMDVEKYLLPYTKQTFGERVVLKVDVEHKITGDGSWWAGYKSVSLAEMTKDIAEDPERNRIELELYIYIFDRIDSEREKEERRKQIFDYVQYLKEEGLFNYLELGVIFIDERVLAPSYWEYARDIYPANLVEEEVEGETVYLPPRDLRKEMSEVLQREINEMSEEELLVRMGKIRKSELGYNGIREYNTQYMEWIISLDMMKVNRKNFFEKKKKQNELDKYYYDNLSKIDLSFFSDYIYVE
ncbi:MAG: hypothetical protein FH762_05735 [Firmicutes bacterium]|nr:hypothetical protein [Bacillota bacterium]